MKYSIGVDFGTLSGRAVLVETETGNEFAYAVKQYTHGVMDTYLPDGFTKLEADWALQHPKDYLEVLEETIPQVLKDTGIDPADVIGLGIDFTACTMLPVYADGTPLCYKHPNQPHAYVKLWKHHAAQDEANQLNDTALKRNETFIHRYGGKISSEWLIPKIWQILDEAPEMYDEADRMMEAADWVVMQLTGQEARNSCTAGYKGIWSKKEGYPSKDFFKALDQRLENVVEEKLSTDIYPIGAKAGEITAQMAKMTGLAEGTAVAVANVDAHVSIPAVGIVDEGKMLMIMGTSTCHILLGKEEKMVPGMCGVVEDGVLPGFHGYEAGQSCVGDHFQWFADNCVPKDYIEQAHKKNVSVLALLTEKANKLLPGESGLIALDWWNGNRSVLVDVDLTGMIVGCNLQTKPEEIYRALMEATAYGTRMIIDQFEESGVPITELYAAGGIAEKDTLMMQIYSDVTNREIRISGSSQAPALGSAMFGGVAAGRDKGGFENIRDAAKAMSKVKDMVYRPISSNVQTYDRLYKEYLTLHDYFGRGQNDVMKRLKRIKNKAMEVKEHV